MAAAYLVKYTGPRGNPCPDAVVVFESDVDEDLGTVASLAKAMLVNARGGYWTERDVRIHEMRYLGPWFSAISSP